MGINKRASTGREERANADRSPTVLIPAHPLTYIYSAVAFPFLCGTVKRHESIQEAVALCGPEKVQMERFQRRESAVGQRQRQFPGLLPAPAGGSTFAV